MIDPLLQLAVVLGTSFYQAIAVWQENRQTPPGQRIDVGGYKLHLYQRNDGPVTAPPRVPASAQPQPTIVIDHSLGGVEGYLLLDALAHLGPVCSWDRAGYGWSDRSPHPRTSDQIATEFDTLLTRAGIQPPYLLIGDSFGSYTMRLYAQRFPHKVAGLVLTDGLHEVGMGSMGLPLKGLQVFFLSGFVMCTLGASLGIIRTLRAIGLFTWLKPELRAYPAAPLEAVTRSFCRPSHWLTMIRELSGLVTSGRQVGAAATVDPFPLGALPIVSIKANSFFQPSWWTRLIPLRATNELRDRMHDALLTLSTDCTQLCTHASGHFVWIDEPEVMQQAVKILLAKIYSQTENND
jgi:pimeloyl-ACP methyl ester carboxylesterase